MERERPDPLNLDAGGVPHVADDVVEAMRPWLGEAGAREDGLHARARAARRALDEAREALGSLAGAAPERVVFTSSAAESVLQIVRAASLSSTAQGRTLAYPEHDTSSIATAVNTSARERSGPVRVLPVDRAGSLRADALGDDASLVLALSWAHPILGTVQDVEGLAARLAPRAGVLAVDATWVLGRLRVHLGALEGCVALFADLAPIGVPLGVGVSFVPNSLDGYPLLPGGVEQDGRRSGAVPVALAVGAGAAARRLVHDVDTRSARLREAATRLSAGLAAIAGVVLLGPPAAERLPGHVAVAVPGLRGDALVLALSDRGVLASPGSPCGEAGLPASSLLAAGLPEAVARGAVVLAMPAGAAPPASEIERAIAAFAAAVAAVRAVAGVRR